MRKGGDRSIDSKHIPPMTPEGEAKLKTHIPARGRPAGEPLNGENPALVRAVVPALSNDPMMTCNPQGFPRLLLDPEFVEFGEFRGRILQLFQWSRTLRELWLEKGVGSRFLRSVRENDSRPLFHLGVNLPER